MTRAGAEALPTAARYRSARRACQSGRGAPASCRRASRYFFPCRRLSRDEVVIEGKPGILGLIPQTPDLVINLDTDGIGNFGKHQRLRHENVMRSFRLLDPSRHVQSEQLLDHFVSALLSPTSIGLGFG